MAKFNVPSKKFAKKPKKMVSWRLTQDLLEALDKMALKKGWTTTDLVSVVLDQYLQSEEK